MQSNSKKFALDTQNIVHIIYSAIIGLLTIYASNTEFFNTIIARYVSPETFTVVTMVLSYAVKKFLTDYSK